MARATRRGDVKAHRDLVLGRTAQKNPSPLPATEENQRPVDDGSEDELSPAQPNITLPLRDEGDSFDALPPRLSMALDENDETSRSIEVGRRESVRDRLSRGGLRDPSISGQFPEAEASELGLEQRPEPPEDDEMDELSRLDFANQRSVP